MLMAQKYFVLLLEHSRVLVEGGQFHALDAMAKLAHASVSLSHYFIAGFCLM